MAAMCEADGTALLCYGSLAGGFLSDRHLGAPEPQPSLANRSLVKYRLIIDEYGCTALGEAIDDLIEDDEAEARSFACNAVVVGRTIVTNTGCPKLHRDLKNRGFEPVETPLGEFVKAGGSAKCLTLRLDGEEAAPWRGSVEKGPRIARMGANGEEG